MHFRKYATRKKKRKEKKEKRAEVEGALKIEEKNSVHTSSLKDKPACYRTLFWNLWKRFSFTFSSLFVYRFIRVLTGGPLQGLTFEKGKEHNPPFSRTAPKMA